MATALTILYAQEVESGNRTIEEVPKFFREKVKAYLKGNKEKEA
ncbi:CD1375 family protein [Listeria monocytogenes]|nr:CD1375 family protein [Listeria monocytogenes]